MDVVIKQCSKCHVSKLLTDFNRRNSSKDRHRSICRACQRAEGLVYASTHRPQIAAYGRRYFADNRSAIYVKKPERDHRYNWELRQRVFAQYDSRCACCGEMCLYFLQITHPDGRHAPHVEEIGYVGSHGVCWYLQRHGFPQDYRLLCANCLRAMGSFRFCPHHELDHRDMTINNTRRRWDLRLQVLAAYGNRCACCDEASPYFLEVDHPKGDGSQHRKVLGITAGQHFYQYLKGEGFPRGYRLLCSNCNTARGWYGFCPHREEIPERWKPLTYDATPLLTWE